MFGNNVMGGWRKLHNEELHLVIKYYEGGDQIKEDEMGGVCSADRGGKKA
jgi:hypothetical protein